jgi:hypothetical protein
LNCAWIDGLLGGFHPSRAGQWSYLRKGWSRARQFRSCGTLRVALVIVHAERVQDDGLVVLVQWMSYVLEDDPW